jgi:uncharacterized protein
MKLKSQSASPLQAFLYKLAGIIFVILGVVGILLPIMPTTPFLLAAAACFVRGSDRLYQWLITNPICGEYIRRYRDKEGIPLLTKIFTLLLLWTSLSISALLFAHSLWLKLLLLTIGIGISIHLLCIKTYHAKAMHKPKQPGSINANNHDLKFNHLHREHFNG